MMIKQRKKYWTLFICIILTIGLLSPQLVFANGKSKKKLKYRISFNYFKSANGDKTLHARLYYKKGKKFVNVQDEEISFYTITEDEETLLAKTNTNANGEAVLLIDAGYALPWDSLQMCGFTARYKGNDIARKAKKEILIRDVNIGLEFKEEDDEKTVTVIISSTLENGEIALIEDAEVYAYVDRMLSLLPFGEGFSDAEGKLVFDFPAELPGDSIGNVKVVIKIEESDDYGNIETNETIDWGIAVDYSEQDISRSLWTNEAPVWMSLTVLILLAGAWFNFVLAIFKIVKIKKLGEQ